MAKLKTGLVILALLIVFSLVTAERGEMNMENYLSSPSVEHPFGCDREGRDLLSRTSAAFLVSLSVSLISTVLGLLTALVLVFLIRNVPFAGSLLHSLVKALRTVPAIILGLFLLSFPGNGTGKLIFTLALSSSAGMTLLLVPLLDSLEGEEYIIAERSLGIGERKIYMRHIVPSLKGVIMEEFSSTLISSIITESSLSFLGLGLDPSVPTLGRLLTEGRSTALTYPHTIIFPSVVLFLLGLGVLLVNRGLSELDSSSH